MFELEFGIVTFDILFQPALGRPGSETMMSCKLCMIKLGAGNNELN